MLECKDKEQAVFYLYRLYGLKEVDAKVLRPPVEEESLRTGGRKSSKRKKATTGEKLKEDATEEVEEGGKAGLAGTMTKTRSRSPRRASRATRKGLHEPTDGAKLVGEVETEADEHGLTLGDTN